MSQDLKINSHRPSHGKRSATDRALHAAEDEQGGRTVLQSQFQVDAELQGELEKMWKTATVCVGEGGDKG